MGQYIHLETDSEIRALAGYYSPRKEVRLPHDGREIIYVVGDAVVDSACCGNGSFAYAIVPGYIVNWQNATSTSGQPISDVEPVTDKATIKEVRKIISESEGITQVDFW